MAGPMRTVYQTIHGEFHSGPFVGEQAQIGLRLAFAETEGVPARGETFEPNLHGDPTVDFGTEAGTNGVLSKTWKARVGDTGSLDNWDSGAQIAAAEITRDWLNQWKTWNSSAFRWTHVKSACVDVDGKTPVAASTYTFNTPIVGTATTNVMPAQVALAVSLRANIAGRKGRGRVYWPAIAGSLVGGDGSLNPAATTDAVNQFKAYVNNLGGIYGISTFHRSFVVITSAPAQYAVRPVEVRLGNLFDTIKSRRAQVEESYGAATL